MPLYTYKVKDKSGKTLSGKMSQENPSSVAQKLKEMGYTIVNISLETPGMFSMDIGEKFTRIKLMDKATFYIKLASMLKAGVPLASSLESVREQVSNKKFQRIIDDIYRNILAGNSLSQSLSLYPRIFPELLINVVQSGEASGKLIDVLDQYAVFSENQAALHQKIISALTYPCIVLIAAGGLMFVFLTFLLPRFVGLFKEINVPLPLVTQILVRIGNFFGSNRISILVGIIVLIILFKIFSRIKFGKVLVDHLRLNLPYTGRLVRKVSIARFTRTLGTLYTSGVPILRSLEICEKSTGNSVFAKAINVVKEAIAKGKSFAEIMGGNPIFPKDMTQMIAIGERSGNLSEMLFKISEFYERDVEYAIKNISSFIEPIILLMVGAVVGVLAYSVIVPVFDIMKGL